MRGTHRSPVAPSQSVSNEKILYLLCRFSDQAVKQRAYVPAVWDKIALMWRPWNDTMAIQIIVFRAEDKLILTVEFYALFQYGSQLHWLTGAI